MAPFKKIAFVGVLAVCLGASSSAYSKSNNERMLEALVAQAEDSERRGLAAKKLFAERLSQAEQGDAEAQYRVGTTYALPLHGQVKQNLTTAFQWYLKSAQQGYLPAQEAVAVGYHGGEGTKKDLVQAFQWSQKAAAQGSDSAKLMLASMYEDGEGVAASPQKALDIYLALAKDVKNQSYNRASLALVRLYKKHYPNERQKIRHWMETAYAAGWVHLGRELVAEYTEGNMGPPNEAKARQVLSEMYGRSTIDADEMYRLATMYETGRGGAKSTQKANELFARLAQAGHPEALLRHALSERLSAAEGGNAQAQYDVGLAYSKKSEKTLKDVDQAIFWLGKAAQQKHKQAQRTLARFYLQPDAGARQSEEKAFALYEEVAQQGDTEIQFQLAKHYQQTDPTKALHWLEMSAKSGDANGQLTLGNVFFRGLLGVQKDERKAVEWFLRSAKQGHMVAEYEMGHMYDHGHGVEKNLKTALSWFEKSAKQGFNAAIKRANELRNTQ